MPQHMFDEGQEDRRLHAHGIGVRGVQTSQPEQCLACGLLLLDDPVKAECDRCRGDLAAIIEPVARFQIESNTAFVRCPHPAFGKIASNPGKAAIVDNGGEQALIGGLRTGKIDHRQGG